MLFSLLYYDKYKMNKRNENKMNCVYDILKTKNENTQHLSLSASFHANKNPLFFNTY